VKLTDEDIEQLQAHQARLKSLNALNADIAKVLAGRGTCPDRKTLTAAMNGSDVMDWVVQSWRRYLGLKHQEFLVHHHKLRYTGTILPNALRAPKMETRAFKSALIAALKCERVDPAKLDVLGLRLPSRIAFVNHTGQWLKPILRKLLQHPQGVSVEVYVCDPSKTFVHSNGLPEIVEVLGVLEFLWSLPTALELHRANRSSKLSIFTYDGSNHNKRFAYFEGDMVARSYHLRSLADRDMVIGHPGTSVDSRCILGAEDIDVILRGDPAFKHASDEVEQCLSGGKTELQGLNAGGPRMSWSSKGFQGLAYGAESKAGLWDISPHRFLCPKPFQAAKPATVPEINVTHFGLTIKPTT